MKVDHPPAFPELRGGEGTFAPALAILAGFTDIEVQHAYQTIVIGEHSECSRPSVCGEVEVERD